MVGRDNCPIRNIGYAFGLIDSDSLEGSILDPDYCIVTIDGCCKRHHAEGDNGET